MAHYLIKTSEFITVGESSYFNGTMKRKGTGKITIGSYCAFGDNLNLIAGNNHGYGYAAIQVGFYRKHFPHMRYPGYVKPCGIKIGSDVWIGDNVTILDGASVGNGVVIAAGAVVPGKTYEDYSIIGGVPAKTVKMRFPDHVKRALIELSWWDKSSDWVSRNSHFFSQDLSNMSESKSTRLLASLTDT